MGPFDLGRTGCRRNQVRFRRAPIVSRGSLHGRVRALLAALALCTLALPLARAGELGADLQGLLAYPTQAFEGRITYVYPTLNAETRTVPVRVELANPGQLLKPAMFARIEIDVDRGTPVLAVPDSAVIDTGTRRIVLVQRGEGRFESREVRLGARSDNYAEVLEGVKAGEQVVVAANFLIDADSNLKAAIGGLGSHAGHGTSAVAQDSAASPAASAPSVEAAQSAGAAHTEH
jgi:Cu(I)/Ag(I) efflux system membrane fusion protein